MSAVAPQVEAPEQPESKPEAPPAPAPAIASAPPPVAPVAITLPPPPAPVPPAAPPPAVAPALPPQAVAFLAQPVSKFTESLDELRNQVTQEQSVLRLVAGSASFVSLGVSIIYIFWTLRAGYLVASLLSSMPAWTFIDPLPILSDRSLLRRRDGSDEDPDADDESLQTMVDQDNTSDGESEMTP